MRKAVAFVTLLALCFAAGCGGDDGASSISAEAFTEEVCGASAEWQKTLQTSLTDFQRAASEQSDPAQIKEGVAGAFTNFRGATEDLISKISDMGVPSEEGATEFRDRYTSTLTSIKTSLDKLIDDVGGISTNTEARFKTELQAIAQGFQQSLGDLANPFEDMPAELREKFEQQPSCSGLLGAEPG